MGVFQITGGRTLNGSLRVQGAKNSILPIMAAAIVNGGESVIHNCPKLLDVDASIKILEHLGCRTQRDDDVVHIDSGPMNRYDIPDDLMREMRSSVIFLGAILTRAGKAVLSLPGGCELGPRPINLHLASLRALGADIAEESGNIICTAVNMRGRHVNLSLPSVGATENTMLAALGCEGETVITNAAQEPEIEDLQDFLIKKGAKIRGAGSPTVVVEGGAEGFQSAEHSVIPDRIAVATYLAAVACAGGRARLEGVNPGHIQKVTQALLESGCALEIGRESIVISRSGRLKAMNPIITRPYPGFPTDAQPPLMAAGLCADGTTVFVENIFENRYRHASELARMGANIKIEGKVAVVCGVKGLHGTGVLATDLRGGAALTLAALGAEGASVIQGIHHVDRGYDNFEGALGQLGAEIKRV